jgi:phosphoribosylamine--glycine ligase
MMPAAQDHKRALDGDRGPNTGGMGAYAPSPFVTPDVLAVVRERVLGPALAGMAADGVPYKGILYAGLMLTPAGPKVLEFNCRFGDPETQVVLPLLATDLVDVCDAIVEGRLDRTPVRWADETAVCVVMTAAGYPGDYRKGDAITGVDVDGEDGAVVFHAGTARDNGRVVTAGGRVLGVTGTGPNVAAARERAYARVKTIHFEGAAYRSDIAMRALSGPA